MTVQKIFKVLLSLFSLCIIVLLSSCGGNNEPSPEDNGKDREKILTHWADNIIIPSYEKFKAKFDVMRAKSQAFTASPNIDSLLVFRSAWAEAYAEWEKVEMFEFGPADQYTLRNFFNIYPTDVAGITSNINNPSVNLDFPSAYAQQGFPALDYLINGVGADDNAIVSFYKTDADAAKRVAYVTRIVERMNTLITDVITGWDSYHDTFVTKTGLDIGSSFGVVVNSFVLNYERYIRSGKIGIPSGSTIATGGMIQPEKVEAYYKGDISLTLAKNAHNASVDFFNGKSIVSGDEGPSLKSYLDALEAKDATTGDLLSEIINAQYTLVSGELDQLSNDFTQQVQTDNQEMAETYAAMQKLVRILKVDMTSATSITITYTDNDGD